MSRSRTPSSRVVFTAISARWAGSRCARARGSRVTSPAPRSRWNRAFASRGGARCPRHPSSRSSSPPGPGRAELIDSDPSAAQATGHARTAGRWLVLAAALCWGTTATLARSVFRDDGVPALTVVELRLAFAAALLFLWMAARKRDALRLRRNDLFY